MNAFHLRSFIFASSLLGLLIANLASALPTTKRQAQHTAVPTFTTSNDDTQTIETVQVFTVSGGNTTETCTLTKAPTTITNGDAALVLTKSCSFNFTPSSPHPHTARKTTLPAPTSVPVPSTLSSSSRVTTVMSSTTPTSVGLVSLSIFTTNALPTSARPASKGMTTPSPTPTTSNIVSQPTIASDASTSDIGASVTLPNTTSLSSPTLAASSTSSVNPFTATAESHLSSLPIFLGAFGGIAGLAILVVAFKVYHPVQRFNEMRLQPPSVLMYLKGRSRAGRRHATTPDTEKSGRLSQEMQTQSEHTDGPVAW